MIALSPPFSEPMKAINSNSTLSARVYYIPNVGFILGGRANKKDSL